MIKAYIAPALSSALSKLKEIIAQNEELGKETVIFCEDRLSLAAERTICSAVGGSFLTSVYSFGRFLSTENGKPQNVLSSQGSAMALRKLIDENRDKLNLFSRLSGATAAQDVYDTIALLYSSRVTPDDLAMVNSSSPLLDKKVKDLELLYREYSDYLRENDCIDRNAYLRLLPDIIKTSKKIKGKDVILLGFQAFTCSVSECAYACMEVAQNVLGFFIGGKEDIYTNEAIASFSHQASYFGGCETERVPSTACPEAEHLRKNIFNPESFHYTEPKRSNKVCAYEAVDAEEELEYVAANVIKHVFEDGVRYRSISVMVPDLKAYQSILERVFAEYSIPYYVDRRYSLAEHPVCSFVLDYLSCVSDGCLLNSVSAVVSSPLFGVNKKDKDLYINYALRLAAFRGGVKREPDPEILKKLKYDISAVQRIRERFLDGLKTLPSKADGRIFCNAIRELLVKFNAQEVVAKLATSVKDEYPSLSAFSERAVECALSVIDEAEKLTSGMSLTAREFSKILKSGFTAMEISLIPPKADAVFVGDIAKTANTGSEVLFALGLTDAVPCSSQDTAILTDKELSSLAELQVVISPKINQVNMRARELTALNICAFKKKLYLTYTTGSSGDEARPSEIITYFKQLFRTPSGGTEVVLDKRKLERSESVLPYYSSRPMPAARQLLKTNLRSGVTGAVYSTLVDNGHKDLADRAMTNEDRTYKIECGKALYGNYVSPTTLETYFACPYTSFMKQGLKVNEREEGVMRPLDSGNFIHTVLQKLAYSVNGIETVEELTSVAEGIAEKLLQTPQYASLNTTKRGEYTAKCLVEEATDVAKGMFEQLKNSKFTITDVEKKCDVVLDNGVKIGGRIDRVDSCGDMVRIIDYKTGSIDDDAYAYYMGTKLQLPLYLLSVSKGKRPVGAYYFPAKVAYADKVDGVYRLKGFMDGSDEVVRSSDTTVLEKKKSEYFNAYFKGRKVDGAMPPEDFKDFLDYSVLVSRKGINEMMEGNVAPMPTAKACDYCKMGGSCRFSVGGEDEPRKKVKINCEKIARIVREYKGDE